MLLLIDLVSCLNDADTPDLLIMRGAHNCKIAGQKHGRSKSRVSRSEQFFMLMPA